MNIVFSKPNITNIDEMQELVKEDVINGNILLRTNDEMANTIRSYIIVKVDDKLAGFVALNIYSKNLAEVRSLIISKKFRGLKLGRKLIKACIKEARGYKLKQLLALTYEEGFFKSLDFELIEKENIPEHKIWADCIRCKHFPVCDEKALIYKLD